MPRRPFHPTHAVALLLIFFLGVLWSSVVLLTGHHYRHSPGAEESLIAKHLVRGEGFSSPMDESPRAQPTSWSPPVYPCIEATAFRLFGIDTLRATIFLATLNAISFAIVAASTWQLATIAAPDRARQTAITAIVILFAHPILMRFVYDYWDGETSLAIFMLTLAFAATWGTQPLRLAHAAILGALLGILSLANAAYILSYPLIILFAARQFPARQKLKPIFLALLTFIVTLLPWTARNYKEFGRLMYVRGGAALELYNGNRPQSSGWLSPRTMVKHPFKDQGERALLLQLGEMNYFDFCGQRFRDDLHADPRHFLTLTLTRIRWLFLGDPGTRGWIPFPMRWGIFDFDIEHLVLLSTSILGLIAPILARACHPERYAAKDLASNLKPDASRSTAQHDNLRKVALYLLSIAIASVAPFFITSTADRYALPLRTILCLLSAITITGLISRRSERFAGQSTPAP